MNPVLVADESVDFRIVTALRKLGLLVHAIIEEQPSISDEAVLRIAFEMEAVLITEDKDFGELVFRLRLPHKGILLIRIEERGSAIQKVAEVIASHIDELRDHFSVLNERKLRIKV